MLDTPLQKWYCWHVGVAISFLPALAVSGKDKKFSWRFVYPLSLFVLFVVKLYSLEFLFNAQIFVKKLEIGTGISAEDWKIRNSYGYSINKEPLKNIADKSTISLWMRLGLKIQTAFSFYGSIFIFEVTNIEILHRDNVIFLFDFGKNNVILKEQILTAGESV